MKKIISLLCATILTFGFTGCGNSASSTSSSTQNKTPLSKAEFVQLYSEPSKFKGRSVDFYARILIKMDMFLNLLKLK